jgi:hypothetical protein
MRDRHRVQRPFVEAAADGHTLLMAGSSSAINATLYQKLDFNFRRDIAPVAAIARSANVMLLNPSLPASTLAEFIALAQANPGKLKLASAARRPGSSTGSTARSTRLSPIRRRPRGLSNWAARSAPACLPTSAS